MPYSPRPPPQGDCCLFARGTGTLICSACRDRHSLDEIAARRAQIAGPSPLDVQHLLHALLEDARAAVDSGASPTLEAQQICGFIQWHWRRLIPAGVASVQDLRHLRVVVAPGLCGHHLADHSASCRECPCQHFLPSPDDREICAQKVSDHSVTLDFSQTPLAGRL